MNAAWLLTTTDFPLGVFHSIAETISIGRIEAAIDGWTCGQMKPGNIVLPCGR
jgi:hypothetical protein